MEVLLVVEKSHRSPFINLRRQRPLPQRSPLSCHRRPPSEIISVRVSIYLVYLFILSQRIVGCLVAEPIKEAHKVLSCAVNRSYDGTTTNEAKLTTLQFGDIKFQRETMRKAPSVPEALNENLNGAIFWEEEVVPAVCGIRAIWVTQANRRKHIATQLLDALRKSFCMGFVLEHSQLAFSQPTSVGKALASNYIGGGYFLVYKTNNLKGSGGQCSFWHVVTTYVSAIK